MANTALIRVPGYLPGKYPFSEPEQASESGAKAGVCQLLSVRLLLCACGYAE